MNDPFLDLLPLWAFPIIAALILGLALEGGYRLGQWRKSRAAEEREQPVGGMVASILGLVALVLGFSFGLVAARFDARRMGVLDEANAIGTTYLRTRLLPEPQQTESARLLREYVDVRIQAAQETLPLEQILARSQTLQDKLWQQATEAAEQKPTSIMAGLYVQSLNQVIDMHATRLLAARSRLPLVLLAALFLLAALGMAAVGYQSAIGAARRSPAMIALVLAFATVLYLIADLDRAQDGLLRVSQRPLLDLRESMSAPVSLGNPK